MGEWDSGQVQSNNTVFVPYGGPPLAADTSYSWSVVWSDGQAAAPAASATLRTGLFAEADWQGAAFVGDEGHRVLQATFTLPHTEHVRMATAYVAAPGGFALLVNDQPVGPQFGVSAWPEASQAIYYQAINVPSAMLQAGAQNSLTVFVGHGFAAKSGFPLLLSAKVLLSLQTDSGARLFVTSGGNSSTEARPCVANVPEHTRVVLGCPAPGVITGIAEACYGTPTGTCASGFTPSTTCNLANISSILASMCVGRPFCIVEPGHGFLPDPCFHVVKHLSARVTCGAGPSNASGALVPSSWTGTAGPYVSDDPFLVCQAKNNECILFK